MTTMTWQPCSILTGIMESALPHCTVGLQIVLLFDMSQVMAQVCRKSITDIYIYFTDKTVVNAYILHTSPGEVKGRINVQLFIELFHSWNVYVLSTFYFLPSWLLQPCSTDSFSPVTVPQQPSLCSPGIYSVKMVDYCNIRLLYHVNYC